MTLTRERAGARPGLGAHGLEEAPHTALRGGYAGLRDLMDALLAEDGCPWDREQTLDTLRPYLLEEAHEVLEAMGDPARHRDELGDLLFQILFQSALRERSGDFNLEDVVAAIRNKMLRRHPHVFGEPDASGQRPSPEAVQAQWERIKADERRDANEDDGIENPLTGVPVALPALARAQRLQEKAASIGFDWPDLAGAVDKWAEEHRELEEAIESAQRDAIEEELGDLLFVLVRVAGKLGIHAEDAVRAANQKFERRFRHIMSACATAGVRPADAGLEFLDAAWDDAKRKGL